MTAAQKMQLVMLVAPSGYGKTTLLTEVYDGLEAKNMRVIWINVTRGTHDGGWLSRALSEQVALLFDLRFQPSDTFTNIVFENLSEDNPLFVFIDNWNFLDEVSSAPLFERLLAETHGLIHFVVSSRSIPSFHYAPLRLNEELLELTSGDLSFTLEESSEVLGIFDEISQPLLQLIGKTQGWPAAVQMLKLALREGGSGLTLSENFDGAQADIARYFSSSFFDLLSEERKRFYLNLALFEEFRADLIETVFGPNVREPFRDLVLNGVFISEVFRGSGRYKLHPLLRDYLIDLRPEFSGLEPETQSLLKAAHFEREQGEIGGAIEYAIRSKQFSLAVELLSEHTAHITEIGRIHQFANWAGTLQGNGAVLPPDVARWYIWTLVFSGNWREAAAEAVKRPEVVDAEIETVIAAFSDDLDTMRSGLSEWRGIEKRQQMPFQAAVMHCAEAIAFLAEQRFSDAERSLNRAEFSIDQTESVFGRIWVAVLTAMLYYFRARLDLAERKIRDAIRLAERHFGPNSPTASLTREVAANIAFERCADEQAQSDLKLASVANRSPHLPFIMALTDNLVIELRLKWGAVGSVKPSASERMSLFKRAQKLSRELRSQFELDEAENAVAAYDVAQQQSNIGDNRSVWDIELIELSNSARLFLLQGNPKAALGILTPVLRRLGQSEGLTPLSLNVLRAAALYQVGETSSAVRLIIATTEKAVTGGALRRIFQDRRFIEGLLPALADAGHRAPLGDPEGWRRLRGLLNLKTFETKESSEVVELIEEPTARELELLEFVGLGLSNREIGERLGITVPTVKWHLHNLFSKLNVKNRGSALRVAREAGLVR